MDFVSGSEYLQRKAAGLCVVKRCKNKAGKRFKVCYKHHRQRQKEQNPSRYYFDHLRNNAKNRGIEFHLTIEEFRKFCAETDYLDYKGKKAGNLTVDRKNPKKGYSYNNIQVLTLSQNSRKYWIDLKIRFGRYPTKEELEELYGGSTELVDEILESYEEEETPDDEVPF
tara:strand:+ start:10756 stop:11262 length:507 start_codon:yes stop_codon:yes gene_type:complete